MRTNIFALIVLTLLSTVLVNAQSISLSTDTIRWEISEFEDVHAHVTDQVSSSLITFKQSKIQWSQGNGDYIMTFNINSVSGSWDDPAELGYLDYDVSLDGKVGVLRVEHKSSGIFVSINIPSSGQNLLPFVLHVTSYQLF